MANPPTKKVPYQTKQVLFSLLKILEPSPLGLSIYFVIVIVTLYVDQFLLSIPSLQTLQLSDFQGTFAYGAISDFSKLINTQIANQVVVYIFWAIVATGIYIIARRLDGDVDEFYYDLKLRQYIWPSGDDKNGPVKEFAEKLLFRIVIGIFIIVYIFKIFPLLIRIWQSSPTKLALSSQSLTVLGTLLIEILFLHIAVVLLRLLLIRKRVIDI